MLVTIYKNARKHFLAIDSDLVYQILIVLFIFLFAIKTLISKDFGGDFIAYFLPHYDFIFTSIKHGQVPFWFPYSYNGLPELFKSELAIFHPITIIALISDLLINKKSSIGLTGNIFEILWFLYLTFGGIGMYRVTRYVFNTQSISAFIAALIFCLNPLMLTTMNTNVFLGVCILPWIIYYLALLLEKPSLKHSIFYMLANFLLFASGYPYFYVYFLLAQVAFTLYYPYKRIGLVSISYVLSFMLAAFILFPNTYIYLQSNRNTSQSSSSFELFTSNIPTRIVNLLNPMPYGVSYSEKDPGSIFTSNGVTFGTFSLIFLLLGISSLKNKYSAWLVGVFFIAFFYSFGGYMSSSQFFGSFIPLINKFRSHSIALVLSLFTGCIFIANGIDTVFAGHRNKYIESFLWLVGLGGFICVSIIPIVNPAFASDNLQQVLSVTRTSALLITALTLVHFIYKTKHNVYIYIATLLIVLEFFFYFLHLNGHFLDTSYNKYFRANSLLPVNTVENELYRAYFDNNQFAYNTAKHKVFLYGGYETTPYPGWFKLQNKYGFNDALKISNVKYFITTNPNWNTQYPSAKLLRDTGPLEKPAETFVSSVAGLPFLSSTSQNAHYIYEIQNYVPRFYAPKKVINCKKEICNENDRLPEVAHISQTQLASIDQISNKHTIIVKTYMPNKIVLATNSDKPTFVVAAETWDSGWKLRINNKPEELYKVDDYFRGFLVPEGDAEIIMEYTPPFLLFGSLISILGIFSIVVYCKIYRLIARRLI